MTQSNIKLSMINILHFLFFLGISPARGGSMTCGLSQCCWLIESWKAMGKTTSVDQYHPTACCRMNGVTCTSAGTVTTVTKIDWNNKGLTGTIPASLINLKHLQKLVLNNNPSLRGEFTRRCITTV